MPLKIKAKPRRFGLLVRVSTREQATSGHSLGEQKERGLAYIEKCAGVHARTYEAHESATGETRRSLNEALDDAGTVYTDLVIQDTTRLSRNPGVMFQAITRLQAAGVTLHDFTGPLPFDTPQDEFRLLMDSVVGRYTARQGVRKSIDIRVAILAGGGIAAGRPPWGREWLKKDQRFQNVPQNVALLKDAYNLIVARGYSLNRAAAELKIAPSSLRKAFAQSAQSVVVQRLEGRTFTFPCQPLLTPSQQSAVLRRLAENAVIRPHAKGQYTLQGLVRCTCGATMTGQTSTKNGNKYAVYRHPPASYKAGCTWGVPVDLLDADVVESCGWLLWSHKHLKEAIRNAVGSEANELDRLNDVCGRLRGEIAHERNELDALVDALAGLSKSGEARSRTHKRIQRGEAHLADKVAELSELEHKSAMLHIPPANVDIIAAHLRRLFPLNARDARRRLPFAQRREFVRAMVGRDSRNSEAGIVIRMFRAPGASKKDIRWSWELHGRFAILQNYIERNSQDDMPNEPTALRLTKIAPSTATQFALMARHSKADVQSHTKSSSGD